MKTKIENKVFGFFVDSDDFNGIPLRNVSKELEIDYVDSIDIIKELVIEDKISIQSSTNPHIIYSRHYPVGIQLKILEDAKTWKVEEYKIGELTFQSENTEFPICLYPSINLLSEKRDLKDFDNAPYSRRLALGEPQLKPVFFEIEVLERYSNDPRFNFKFEDYSGRISCKYDDNNEPLVRKEDDVFLKTFGLGFDPSNRRLAVVYLRYLSDLTPEHQIFWKTREKDGECLVVAEYVENTIEGKWTSSYSIFSGFIGEQTTLNSLTRKIFKKPLFNKDFNSDNRPKEFTFFFTPTLKNYNDFVHLLDKMISDNLNKKFFEGKVDMFEIVELEEGIVERKPKGTIRLFEEWLTKKFKVDGDEEIKSIFKSFKKIRRERQNPAHKISENEYDEKYVGLQQNLMDEAYNSMRHLRHIFQQHPKANGFEIPKWIESGEVKSF